MDVPTQKALLRFRRPDAWFSGVDARSASALFAASSDVSLVVDGSGVVQDIALGNEDFYPLDLESWIGRQFQDIVAVDSRAKAAASPFQEIVICRSQDSLIRAPRSLIASTAP